MNSSKFRFMLDLHTTQSQISIPVSLGDTGRVWYISFADGGMPYIIPDGVLAKISIKRQTGRTLEAFCAIEKNTTVKYDFASDEITVNTAAVAGIHDISITLYDEDGRILGSPRFTMVVSDRVINKDDITFTDSDITAIDAILVKEAERQVAETARGNAETSRSNAESTREIAEIDRATAEVKRANAESLRDEAETERSVAESLRVEAEEGRALAEEERVETIKQIKESLEKSGFKPVYTSITLLASAWKGVDDPYSQVVSIPGVTKNSKVDLLPSAELLAVFHDKDIALVTENDDGVVTVYAIGDKPSRDYTMEVCITEVRV